ncbi:MAG: nucleotidyltransferase [Clostridiales bacterium]|nr:nucleotidyltransferase [Clostridiales bacterium]
MNKPILVIMAAGIGSRFGGLKQMAPVGKHGEAIIEFSIYDAIQAGFEKVVFIIKKEIEDDFRKLIGDKVKDLIEVEYAFQELNMLPEGYEVPEGRVKPWGTGHAVLCAKQYLDQPFAVINADDYYGKHAFRVIYHNLKKQKTDDKIYRLSMVGYQIENTLSDHGHVTRGVCELLGNFLESIVECAQIQKRGDLIEYTDEDGKIHQIEKGTTVSMNLWGLPPSFLDELENRFPAFLDKALKENPIKAEFLLPTIINDLLHEEKATVEVLRSLGKWYGVTYKEDLEPVAAALQAMQDKGDYPQPLFSK